MYCDTCVPAVIVTGSARGSPAPRNSTLCVPALSVTVSGVTPLVWPSTTTCAPGGLLLMLSVPVAPTAGVARKYLRAPNTPTVDTTMSAAAAAATMLSGRLPVGAVACDSCCSSASSSASWSKSCESCVCDEYDELCESWPNAVADDVSELAVDFVALDMLDVLWLGPKLAAGVAGAAGVASGGVNEVGASST